MEKPTRAKREEKYAKEKLVLGFDYFAHVDKFDAACEENFCITANLLKRISDWKSEGKGRGVSSSDFYGAIRDLVNKLDSDRILFQIFYEGWTAMSKFDGVELDLPISERFDKENLNQKNLDFKAKYSRRCVEMMARIEFRCLRLFGGYELTNETMILKSDALGKLEQLTTFDLPSVVAETYERGAFLYPENVVDILNFTDDAFDGVSSLDVGEITLTDERWNKLRFRVDDKDDCYDFKRSGEDRAIWANARDAPRFDRDRDRHPVLLGCGYEVFALNFDGESPKEGYAFDSVTFEPVRFDWADCTRFLDSRETYATLKFTSSVDFGASISRTYSFLEYATLASRFLYDMMYPDSEEKKSGPSFDFRSKRVLYEAMASHLKFRCQLERETEREGIVTADDDESFYYKGVGKSDVARTCVHPLFLRYYCMEKLRIDFFESSSVKKTVRANESAAFSKGAFKAASKGIGSIVVRDLKIVSDMAFSFREPWQAGSYQCSFTNVNPKNVEDDEATRKEYESEKIELIYEGAPSDKFTLQRYSKR